MPVSQLDLLRIIQSNEINIEQILYSLIYMIDRKSNYQVFFFIKIIIALPKKN